MQNGGQRPGLFSALVALAVSLGTTGNQPGYQQLETTHNETWQVWLRKWIGALATLVAVIITVCFAAVPQLAIMREQATIAKSQLNLIELDLRPWVYSQQVSILGPITRDESGIRISLNFPLRNTGKLPAQQTFVSFDTYIGPMNFDDAKKKACTDAETNFNGISLFPDTQPTNQGVSTLIPRDYIERMRAAPNSLQPGNIIIACISYQIPNRSVFHHTPYALVISDRDGSFRNEALPFVSESLPSDAVMVRRLPTNRLGPAD